MARGVYWFRNDLRLNFNPLFEKACIENDLLACVFVHDPRQYSKTPQGLPRIGLHRRRFLKETLLELNTQLNCMNLELIEVWGHPEEVLPQLIQELSLNRIYFSLECAPEEKTIENMLRARLEMDVSIVSDWTHFLIQPSRCPIPISEIPDVFSDFRRILERLGLDTLINKSQGEMETFKSWKPKSIKVEEYRALKNVLSLSEKGSQWWDPFPEEMKVLDHVSSLKGPIEKFLTIRGGESHALSRLEKYFFQSRAIENYFTTRNGLLGLFDSTLFSPWLANGSLSAEFIFFQVKKYEQVFGSRKDTNWVIVELLWRDFFKFMLLKHGTSFFHPGGFRKKKMPVKSVKQDRDSLDQLLSASTEESFINANMRELIQTGFMSNRGRQNVASYAIHQLKIPWFKAASLFETLLIDYDVASNWGNWAYLAGVGNDPRGERVFDVKKQQQMYDQDLSYTRAWS